jgi:hypothetical protein
MAQIILDSNNNLIQGDFDNATLNNRTKLQTTTTNATTNVYVVPNGSSTSAGVSVANNSSLTNASKIVMATNGTTDTQIISGVNGSGTYLPMSFYTNNTLAMQIGTNGQVTVAATANPAFYAYRQSSQSVTSDVFTKVALNAEVFDTNNNFDSTTNYRFTPTVAGYYQFNALISLNGTATTNQFIGIIAKNGATNLQRNFDLNPSASLSSSQILNMSASQLYYLNGSTDYVELYTYYYLGTSTISGSGGYQTTILSGSMVRSA